MDYSLLAGVDVEKKQLVLGLVDYIGPYSWYKVVETKGKKFAVGKATVIPPADYKERFMEAIKSYFFGMPDRWTTVQVDDVQNVL